MATLATILTADVSIPLAIEKKFPMLPKLSTQMTTIAGKVPVGPNLPGVAITVLEPPPPNKAGQPLANFFNSAPVTNPFGSAATNPAAVASRFNAPNSARGDLTYLGSPGSARGSLTYMGDDGGY